MHDLERLDLAFAPIDWCLSYFVLLYLELCLIFFAQDFYPPRVHMISGR